MCGFVSLKARRKSLISVLYLEWFLGGLVWEGVEARWARKDKGVLIIGQDNRYFLIVPLVNPSKLMNQMIICTLKTSTVYLGSNLKKICLYWLSKRHVHVTPAKLSGLGSFQDGDSTSKEWEVTARTGKSCKTFPTLAHGEQEGSHETQVRGSRAGRQSHRWTARWARGTTRMKPKCTQSQDCLRPCGARLLHSLSPAEAGA